VVALPATMSKISHAITMLNMLLLVRRESFDLRFTRGKPHAFVLKDHDPVYIGDR